MVFSTLPPDKVIITIGDEKITAGELSGVLESLPEQYRTSANGPGRKQFLDNFIRVKVLAQEGRRRKIDQEATYLAQVAFQQDNMLASATYAAIAKSAPLTDEQFKEYYEKHKVEFESVRASHILIRFQGSPAPLRAGQKDLTEQEALAKAMATRKELLAGGDFAAIAKRDSDDGGSGVQGGDLGQFHRGQMVPPFEQAAFTLQIGQISEPVKTQFGFHLIKVVQREAKSMDEAKPEIDKKLRPETALKQVESLQKSSNVLLDPLLTGEDKKK